MLNETKTEIREKRHKQTQEDFTPECVLKLLCPPLDDELYYDFNITFLDNSAGIGNIICYILKHRLSHAKNQSEIEQALSTMYGTELMEDNVEELKENIRNTIGKDKVNEKIETILKENFVCTAMQDWDYLKWKKKTNGTKPVF